jgi:hypothetical protein
VPVVAGLGLGIVNARNPDPMQVFEDQSDFRPQRQPVKPIAPQASGRTETHVQHPSTAMHAARTSPRLGDPPAVPEIAAPRITDRTTSPPSANTDPQRASSSSSAMPSAEESTVSRPVKLPLDSDAFTGAWLYVPQPPEAGEENLYRPEFIEFQLTEQDGAISGEYRARYRIGNAHISD